MTSFKPNPRLGYAFAGLNAVISGVAIYVSSKGVALFSDATVYTTLKNGVAGLALLLPLFFLARQRAELRRLSPKQWGWLVALAVIGGSVPYALFFQGLKMTTAVTSSLLNHAQFLVVAALALFFLRERVGALVWGALLVLLIGTSLGANVQLMKWNEGALLILISTVLFAAGVVLAKHLLRDVSIMTVMAAKMSLGSVILFGDIAATGKMGAVAHLTATQWGFVLVTGVILLAFTVTAFIALAHASATATTAIPAAAPIITTAIAAFATGQFPIKGLNGLGLALMLVAALAIAIVGARREQRGTPAKAATA